MNELFVFAASFTVSCFGMAVALIFILWRDVNYAKKILLGIKTRMERIDAQSELITRRFEHIDTQLESLTSLVTQTSSLPTKLNGS